MEKEKKNIKRLQIKRSSSKNKKIKFLLNKITEDNPLIEAIKTATKKITKLISRNVGIQDLDWAIVRGNYFLEVAKSPKEYEALAIFIQNLSMIFLKIKSYSKSAFYLHKVISFSRYLKTFTKGLIFYSYSYTLLQMKRIEESKVYCKKALKTIERPVHLIMKLKDDQKRNGVLTVKEKESFTLMLNCYNHLLDIKRHLKDLNIKDINLPDDIQIAEKGLRIAKKYLGENCSFARIFKNKIEMKFQISIKERLTYHTESTRLMNYNRYNIENTRKSANPKLSNRMKKQNELIGSIIEQTNGLYEENSRNRNLSGSSKRSKNWFHGNSNNSPMTIKTGSYRRSEKALKKNQGRRQSLSKFFVGNLKNKDI